MGKAVKTARQSITRPIKEGHEQAVRAIERRQDEEAADRTVCTWNAYVDRYGSPADEYGDA